MSMSFFFSVIIIGMAGTLPLVLYSRTACGRTALCRNHPRFPHGHALCGVSRIQSDAAASFTRGPAPPPYGAAGLSLIAAVISFLRGEDIHSRQEGMRIWQSRGLPGFPFAQRTATTLTEQLIFPLDDFLCSGPSIIPQEAASCAAPID